jgi:sulfoxide reductase heme-binding subunit YedZ
MSKRVRQQLSVAAISGVLTVGLFLAVDSKDATFRWSMATAYVGLALIGFSLIIGPLNVLRGRPNPVSTSLRRDIGIWGGIISLVHTVVGLQVHFAGRFWLYFLYPREESHLVPLRYDFFGLANYSGLGVSLVLVLLLSLSNNAALTRLGSQRWKSLQRLNYAGFALLVVHGAVYQFLEKRMAGFVLVFAIAVLFVGTLQISGAMKLLRLAREVRPPEVDSKG